MLETLGRIVGLCVVGFAIYWAGFFTCACMKAAAAADAEADKNARDLERLRRTNP